MGAARSYDTLSVYRGELAKRQPLTAEEERALSVRWKAGEREAGRRIIEGCLPHVMLIARQYARWGTPMEDLVQQGNIGLLKACERFEPERGHRLVTFAKFWVRAEIRDYVFRNHRVVGLGSSKEERRAVRYFRQSFVNDPEMLAEKTGVSARRAHALLPLLSGPEMPFDSPLHADGRPLSDVLTDSAASPEEEICQADERAHLESAVKTALSELSPREQQIVERHLMSEEVETLSQLGAAFGVSKERIRQVEERAMKRMRGHLQAFAGSASCG
ncbi:sigma-70 family RNA polymerase sigma factor [Chondromyces crocatus]|uniref:RNA polymerase sigma-70 domain-containing protein n=1 Tax=Chondromyces crocatus TaxID=52 RepID=A0A0K1ET70_CHOCO|nr:sigma-70 family RNA polymerase sigma factor [Chondromyces crocatus]AKT43999.1 uncharacterized protein CMC5_082370 [Chondromyces crocatus]